MKAQPLQPRVQAPKGHLLETIRAHLPWRPDWMTFGVWLEKALIRLGEAELYHYDGSWSGVLPYEDEEIPSTGPEVRG